MAERPGERERVACPNRKYTNIWPVQNKQRTHARCLTLQRHSSNPIQRIWNNTNPMAIGTNGMRRIRRRPQIAEDLGSICRQNGVGYFSNHKKPRPLIAANLRQRTIRCQHLFVGKLDYFNIFMGGAEIKVHITPSIVLKNVKISHVRVAKQGISRLL